MKHLEDNKTCPECENIIHQSHPLDYLAYDRTLQDLVITTINADFLAAKAFFSKKEACSFFKVYKIVPGLEDSERQRERAFYKERGLTCPKTIVQNQVVRNGHS